MAIEGHTEWVRNCRLIFNTFLDNLTDVPSNILIQLSTRYNILQYMTSFCAKFVWCGVVW